MQRSESNAEQAFRGLRHIGSARIFTQGVTWTLTVITIHLLRPSDYGLVATSGIFTSFAQLLLDGGLGDLLIAQRVLSQTVQGAAASAVVLIASLLAATVFSIAPAASKFFHNSALREVIEVSAFYLPLSALDVVPIAQLAKRMQFERIALAQAISAVIQGVSTLGLAYAGAGYWALIFGVFIGTGLKVTILWLSLDERPQPNLRFTALAPLVQSSSQIIGQRFIYFCIDNFDLFLLGRFAGPAALGPYSVARNLANSALTQISAVVNQVAVSAFAARTDTESQVRGLIFVISIASVILFPLFWLIGCASQIAFPLFFGARWTNAVVPFLAFSAILPLRSIYTVLNTSVVGTGNTGTTFRNTLSWAAIIMPLMLLGVIKGADGVAVILIPAFPMVFYVALKRISRAFSTTVSTLLHPIIRPIICAGASLLSAEALLLAFSGLLPRPATLACLCCVGGGTYWILIKTLAPAQYRQTLLTARRLISA